MSLSSDKVHAHLGAPLTDSHGVVAIEAALIVPVLFLLVYGMFEIGRYMLVRAHVHRAAASLAEVLIDERIERCETTANDWCRLSDSAVWNAIRQTSPSWPRLVDMMVDNDGDAEGIGVNAIWHSIARDAGRATTIPVLDVGQACEGSEFLPTVYPDLLTRTLETVRNYARPIYLVIHVCYRYRQPSWGVGLHKLGLPDWIESHFVAMRKDASQ